MVIRWCGSAVRTLSSLRRALQLLSNARAGGACGAERLSIVRQKTRQLKMR